MADFQLGNIIRTLPHHSELTSLVTRRVGTGKPRAPVKLRGTTSFLRLACEHFEDGLRFPIPGSFPDVRKTL